MCCDAAFVLCHQLFSCVGLSFLQPLTTKGAIANCHNVYLTLCSCCSPAPLSPQVITLDMGLLVAGTKYRGEFEERLKKLMDEIKQNDDIILVSQQSQCVVGWGGGHCVMGGVGGVAVGWGGGDGLCEAVDAAAQAEAVLFAQHMDSAHELAALRAVNTAQPPVTSS